MIKSHPVASDVIDMKALILILVSIGLFLPSIGISEPESVPEVGKSVILSHEGETLFAEIISIQELSDGRSIGFRYRKFNSRNNLSSKPIRLRQDEAQFQIEVPSLEHQMHNENRTLKKGQIVLTADNKIHVIRAVFADGQVAVHEVVGNWVSKDAIGISRHFEINKDVNVKIINKDEIVAQEVKEFGEYKFSKKVNEGYSEIEGIPICDKEALESYSFREHLKLENFQPLQCQHGKIPVTAIFSNGTFFLGTEKSSNTNKLINPFPNSLHNYNTETLTPASAN